VSAQLATIAPHTNILGLCVRLGTTVLVVEISSHFYVQGALLTCTMASKIARIALLEEFVQPWECLCRYFARPDTFATQSD